MGFLSWLFELPNVSSDNSSDNSNDYIIPNCWAGPFFYSSSSSNNPEISST